jgi:hypothetical protein
MIYLLIIGSVMAISGLALGLGGRKIAEKEAAAGIENHDLRDALQSDSAFERFHGALWVAQGDGIVKQWKVGIALGVIGCVVTVVALVGLALS